MREKNEYDSQYEHQDRSQEKEHIHLFLHG
jgi:hypothetical protein